MMYPHPVTSVLHALSFCSHPMPLWGLSLIACANAILSREVHLLDWWIQTGGFVNTYITIVVKQDMAAYGISKLYNLDVEWTELRSCFFFFCWYLGLLGMRFQCFEVSIGAFECILNYDTWRKNIAGDWWYSFYSDLFSLFWICILSHMVMQVEHEPMQLVFEVSILLLCSLEEE